MLRTSKVKVIVINKYLELLKVGIALERVNCSKENREEYRVIEVK